MEIKGKVHCFFEQSGTFKREFIKLGIPAEDYDIQNNFGETDHTDDLFAEIEKAFDDKPSVFDTIDPAADLIMAFFPCIEFSCVAQMWYSLNQRDYAKWPYKKRIAYMVNKNREPTHGKSFQQTPKSQQRRHMEMKKAPHAGLCSEERSTISPDYARNFICDFIIGKKQAFTQPTLFD